MIDSMLEDLLSSGKVGNFTLSPVPLLGYPGWSEDNLNESYYDDSHYFRSRPIHVTV